MSTPVDESNNKMKFPIIAISLPVGTGIGAAIGTAVNQLPLGVAIGVAIGTSIGVIDFVLKKGT